MDVIPEILARLDALERRVNTLDQGSAQLSAEAQSGALASVTGTVAAPATEGAAPVTIQPAPATGATVEVQP